ncbi:MAG: hypothetical protein N3A61_04955, partial [Ignavibacteria bacterium]|nr:hypothetical protein [Ignavibacteria bacterium]
KSEPHQRMLSSISRSVRYKTYVYAFNEKGTISSPVSTPIFAGIYRNNDGIIDEYKTSVENKAGYGWAPLSGVGTQYVFNSTNLDYIDLVCRSNNNILSLYSPKTLTPQARDTKISQVPGSKQTAFDTMEGLTEPFLSAISIVQDNVYLIKTQDSIYVKLWVKNIKTVGTAPYNYQTVEFEYKVQPIQNLLALKR